MQITKKDLTNSQVELLVEMPFAELSPYIETGARKVSEKVKIEGFRPGKVPYDILKQKIGEMTILEEAAQIAISKNIDAIIDEQLVGSDPVGQPSVEITKLAPENSLEFKIIVSLLPKVTLGEYKNLNIKVEKVELKDEELQKALRDLQEMRAKEVISDKAAQNGDKLTLDIELFLDKVPVEGGQSKNMALILGKEYFVPGFDKQLIGAKKGDEREFQLPYPDNHHQANLAGKLVDFKVKVNDVYERQIPELNDQFAAIFQFKNVDELKKALSDNIKHEKGHQIEHKTEAKMLEQIMEQTKFGDLPDVLLNNEIKTMLGELEQSLAQQGLKFEDYLSHLKKSKEQLMLDLTPSATKRVKTALIVREIAIVEKMEVSDKEIDDKLAQLKETYKDRKEVQEMIKQHHYRRYLENLLSNEKVIKSLKEWNYASPRDKQKS